MFAAFSPKPLKRVISLVNLRSRLVSFFKVQIRVVISFFKVQIRVVISRHYDMENFVCFCDTRSMAPDKRNHQRTPQNYKGKKVITLILPALMSDFLSVLSQLIVLLDDLIIYRWVPDSYSDLKTSVWCKTVL